MKKTLNVYLLSQVRTAIAKANAEKGTGFSMASWFRRLKPAWAGLTFVSEVSVASEEYGSCNTTACIAGHAVGIAGRRRGKMYVEDEAQELLGLKDADAEFLFKGCWSKHKKDDRLDLITKSETVKYLDKCIKAGRIVR